MGTRGEPQVRDILRERLMGHGILVEVLPGARNERGEDGLWKVAGKRPDNITDVKVGGASVLVGDGRITRI